MTLVVALLLLNVLIFIHELGHLLAAQLLDTPVEEFSLGVGPALWEYQPSEQSSFGGTRFVIRWIPIGGFVRMPGDLAKAGKSEQQGQDLDPAPPPGRQILIALAGPLGSIVAMFFLFVVGLGIWGDPPRPHVEGFTEYDAAQFEPAFATAIQATARPTIFMYEPSTAARVDPHDVSHKQQGLPVSSPLAPWERLSPSQAIQKAFHSTQQATQLLGEMMVWLASHPKMFAQNVGSPFGVVEGARRMAATSTRMPAPTPLPADTSPQQIAMADPETSEEPTSEPSADESSAADAPPDPSTSSQQSPDSGPPSPPTSSQQAESGEASPAPSPEDTSSASRPSSERQGSKRDRDSILAGASEQAPKARSSRKEVWGFPTLSETRGYGLVFFYLGVLSVFIAYLNLVPLPPFDGFQIVVSTFELVSRHRVPRKARLVMGIVGAIVIIYILLQGILNDLSRAQQSFYPRERSSAALVWEEASDERSVGTAVPSWPRARKVRLRSQSSLRVSSESNFSLKRRHCWAESRSTGIWPNSHIWRARSASCATMRITTRFSSPVGGEDWWPS